MWVGGQTSKRRVAPWGERRGIDGVFGAELELPVVHVGGLLTVGASPVLRRDVRVLSLALADLSRIEDPVLDIGPLIGPGWREGLLLGVDGGELKSLGYISRYATRRSAEVADRHQADRQGGGAHRGDPRPPPPTGPAPPARPGLHAL